MDWKMASPSQECHRRLDGHLPGRPAANGDCQAALQGENAQLQADGLQAQQMAVQAGLQPPPILLFGVPETLER